MAMGHIVRRRYAVDGEVDGSLGLGVYGGKARASLSHSKAPASDPSARLRAGGGRYKGAGKFLACRKCRT
jgi:hypothetical protein